MGKDDFDFTNLDDLGFTELSDDLVGIDDFDWSDINTRGKKQPKHLFEDYEIEEIQRWMRGCLGGVTQSIDDLSELVGQVCLPDLVDDLDSVALFTDMLGNEEFDSWLAKGPHRNRQRELSPIHLMGAVLNHPEETIVDRHDYYATWLPDIGITVISVYSADPQDIYHHALALGYIDVPYSVTQANNILPMLCSLWRWYTDDISQWEFHYDDEDSPCGTECLFNKELVNEHIRMTITASAETTSDERVGGKPKGTLTYSNGDTYVGEFKDGKSNGQGTYTYVDGGIYIGAFKDGQKNGQGTETHENGVFVGEWKDDGYDKGTLTYPDGIIMAGEWDDNLLNGHGTYTNSDGKTYIGEWEYGFLIGHGTLISANGDTYVGEFNEKTNGQIIYTDEKGNTCLLS